MELVTKYTVKNGKELSITTNNTCAKYFSALLEKLRKRGRKRKKEREERSESVHCSISVTYKFVASVVACDMYHEYMSHILFNILNLKVLVLNGNLSKMVKC
jgi:hypothetical protein